jgi:hypothetical protein
VDIVAEADGAMTAYLFRSFPTHGGEGYLRVFGAIQAVFMQQEALADLINAFHLGGKIQLNDVMKNIREMREAGARHPTRLNRRGGLSSHSIVHNSITKDGFDLQSFPREGGDHFEHIPLLKLLLE